MIGVMSMDSLGEMLGIGFRQFGLFVQDAENATGLGFYQTNAVLIVHKGNLFDTQTLFFVKVLLILEYPLVEKLLEFLVAIIYAKLLKTIHSEVFKASYVEHTDVISRFL